MSVSIIVPCLNEGANVLDTVDALLRNSEGQTEIVVVDDGSTDSSVAQLRLRHTRQEIHLLEAPRIGPARCRNLGAEAATGELLVFVDAHCYLPPGWLPPLLELMKTDPQIGVTGPVISHTGDFSMRGYGGTWHDDTLDMSWLPSANGVTEVPFQPAACQLVRRSVFEQVGRYDEGMTRWGSEDVEFCLRVWLFGHRICLQPDSMIYHYFRQQPPYEVDYEQIVYNKLRMIVLHFSGQRLARVLDRQLQYPHVAAALARLFTDHTRSRRTWLMESRVRDMDWFCDRFGLLAENSAG